MRRPGALTVALSLTLAAGCAPEGPGPNTEAFEVSADTVDPALIAPGVILRRGPATPEAVEGPVYPPVVTGDAGQLSIYEGFFLRAPCSTALAVEASRGDTITVRVWSAPDTTAPTPCPDGPKAVGYAMLVGQFDPGTYAVRLIHDGDGARPAPLDTVYDNITVEGH